MNKYIKFICILAWIFLSSYVLSSQTLWPKYSYNPVLSPGVLNGVSSYGIRGGFDDLYALSPSVLYENGVYKMWYVGLENSFANKFKIGYALSEEGISWCTYSKNPVLSIGNPGEFDAQHVWLSVVIKDNEYKMYYSGTTGSNWTVGLATSSDGIHWSKYQSNPILSLGQDSSWDNESVWGVSVVRVSEKDYRMWYTGRTTNLKARIGYATSTDGIHWAKYENNPVITLGNSASWEAQNVYVPRVVFVNHAFHMFYLGNSGSFGTQIGYSYSSDGIHWNKYINNPVLKVGDPTQWDSYALIDHCVLYRGGTFKIWYGGRSSNGQWQIGYATSKYNRSEREHNNEWSHGAALFPVHPNPFNPRAVIEYDLPIEDQVNITIYNSLGQEVTTLLNGLQNAGHHSVAWDADNYANGIYLCRIKVGESISTQKIALVK